MESFRDMTIGQAQELLALFNGSSPTETPFEVGKAYMIRTVTMHLTGRVKAVVGDFVVLSDAAWIADSGRFHRSLTEGVVDECEPFPSDAIVGLGSVVDATEWLAELPSEVK